jgi:DNA modification methylase
MSSPTVRTRVRPAAAQPSRATSPESASAGAERTLELKVVSRDLDSLGPSPRNARTHSKKQIHQIARSIERFGFVVPILIDGESEVIAGHGRLEAARLRGMKEVPTICLEHMDEADKRAYRLADNRLAELAGWDDELRKVELTFLFEVDIDLPEIVGFDTPEFDAIVEAPSPASQQPDPADAVPEPDASALPVSRLGDLWLLGEHRLLHGEAKRPECYAALLGTERAQMVFVDVPYNVPVNGHVSGTGKHTEFVEASGEMSGEEFRTFLKTSFARLAEVCVDGALLMVCIDWRGVEAVLSAGREAFSELKNIICWTKTNGGMGSLWRSQHELIPVFKNGRRPHINNVMLGKHGRYRTNVWTYAGVNTFKRGRDAELDMHPTVKPTALVVDAIKDCSKPNGIILDSFAGSGTTLIAAAKTKRRGYVMELDGRYVDVIVNRWQALFKAEARHAETGLTFAEMARLRSAEAPSNPHPDEGRHG